MASAQNHGGPKVATAGDDADDARIVRLGRGGYHTLGVDDHHGSRQKLRIGARGERLGDVTRWQLDISRNADISRSNNILVDLDRPGDLHVALSANVALNTNVP